MNECTNEWMNVRMNVHDECMNVRMNECTNECMNEWMYEWIWWMPEGIDKWMNEFGMIMVDIGIQIRWILLGFVDTT